MKRSTRRNRYLRASVSINDRSFLPEPVPAQAGSRQDDKSSSLHSHSKERVLAGTDDIVVNGCPLWNLIL